MTTFNSCAEMTSFFNSVYQREMKKDYFDPSVHLSFNEQEQELQNKIVESHTMGDFESWFKHSVNFFESDLSIWKLPKLGELKTACVEVIRDRDMMLVYWDELNEAE